MEDVLFPAIWVIGVFSVFIITPLILKCIPFLKEKRKKLFSLVTKTTATMNIKALFKAIRFAFLPTLSVLILLFFAFFSISKTIAFISSDSGWAIALRIFLVVAELAMIVIMYFHYLAEEIKANPEENKRGGYPISTSKRVYDLFDGVGDRDDFTKYSTGSSNLILIERKPYSNS